MTEQTTLTRDELIKIAVDYIDKTLAMLDGLNMTVDKIEGPETEVWLDALTGEKHTRMCFDFITQGEVIAKVAK